MPTIKQLNNIDITVEKFLDACSSIELQEVELLITSYRYQSKMKSASQEPLSTKSFNLTPITPNH